MAIAGAARPSARLTLVSGNLVMDDYRMRSGDVLSTPYQAIDKLKAGQVAYVQTYGDNLKIVRAAFEKVIDG